MIKKIAMSLFAALGFVLCASAQTSVVTGRVVSDDGQPVAGASIVVDGTTIGTYADVDGNFELRGVPASAKTLTISFIGLEEVKVAVAPHVTVTMYPDNNTLAETVVVAYGTQTRQSVTGSVAVVDSKKIENRTSTTATAALEGASAGVQVNNTYGEPGSGPTIRIRGFGSMNNNSPLYVVDGVVFDGNISEINPADIASISVLKDAASAALYGNRASNGVIIITTKSGQGSAKPSVTLRINEGWYTRGIPAYETLAADEWMEASWIAMKNYAMTNPALQLDAASAAQYATEHVVTDYARRNIYNGPDKGLFDANGKLTASRQTVYDDLNWFDAVEQVGHRREYTVSGSVATSRFNVYASAGYLTENGYIINTDYNRFTGRLNTNFTPNKWFKTGINLTATVSDRDYNSNANGSYYANPFYIALMQAPVYPYYLHAADGQFILDAEGNKQYDTESSYLDNRNVAYERRHDEQKSHRNVLGGQAYATFMLPYGFNLTFKGDLNHSNTNSHKYDNPNIGDGATNNGRLTNNAYRYTTYTAQELLTWDHQFGKHHVDVLLGHENYQYNSYSFYAMNTGMAIPGIIVMTNFLTNSYVYGSNDKETTESYLARARYNYDEKYYFDASIRRDGSSRFHPDKRWGNFFSFGASWNIKKESFLESVDWVNDLRLRAAFGEVGNNAAVGLYAYQALYEIDKNGGQTSLLKATLSANDISWETTRTIDTALEGSLFNERLNFAFGWFDKRSVDLLMSVPLPLSAGSYAHGDDWNMSIDKNVGVISNRGFEISLSGDIVRTRDFNWSFGTEATILKNKIVTLPDHEDIINGSIRRYSEGKSIYEFYTYKFKGVDQLTGRSLYELDPDKKANAEKAGELVTINGVDYATDTSFGKQDWSGSALPDIYGSFNTAFRWKNFTLSALFTYSLGGKMFDGTYQSLMSTPSASSARANHVDILTLSWMGAPSGMTESSSDRIDPNGFPSIDFYRSSKQNATSDRWLVSNSYFVIKNINLGYTLPTKWVKKAGLESVSVNANVENLLSLSARKGMNPQYSFSGGSDNTYVTARVFNLGLTLNF